MSTASVEHKVWRANAKMSLANERTLIAWVRVGATFGAGAIVAKTLRHYDETPETQGISGMSTTAQALLGLLVVTWGTVTYVRRARLLRERWHGSYEASLGPAVIAMATVGSVLLTASASLARVHAYFSDDCLYLPGRPLHANATPPFLYVSFHGVAQPRRELCSVEQGVAAIHRFTLDGLYAGPATDQRAAMLRYPRGMTTSLGMLFVADSDVADSSIAVFGACAGAAARPFLGRIRPLKGDAAHSAFEHPYAVVAGPTPSKLRVSTQNGGAIIQVSTISGDMQVERQVTPHVSRHDSHSGNLRGLAVESDGTCEHVADKHNDKVWHFCGGGDARPTSTHINAPIDLLVDGDLLYVGSFDSKHPAVYALDLSGGSGSGGDADTRNGSAAAGAAGAGRAYRVVHRYVHPRMRHPAGLLIYQNTLYVLEQSTRSLMAFDVASPDEAGVPATGGGVSTDARFVLEELPDVPEKLTLVTEC